MTKFLADNFRTVTAVDVSAPTWRIAQAYLESCGINNAQLRRLQGPEELSSLGPFSFFYSILVLQHNPPPLMKRMLEIVLSKLRPGGGFLFQTPTHRLGYSFNADNYLSSHDPTKSGFEMHALPMHVILDVIANAGCRLKEVIADGHTGEPGSHTFFGVKPAC